MKPLGRPIRPAPRRSSFNSSPGQSGEDSKSETPKNDAVPRDEWVTDLELMHHFTATTYKTLTGSQRAHHVFKEEIPRIAVRYPYLLHQILAISAFHIAYLRPESRSKYALCGSQHQAHGMAGMREALSKDMTESNNYALVAASSLLMFSLFASRLNEDQRAESSSHLHSMLDFLAVFRGTAALDMFAVEHLQKFPSQDFYDPTMPGIEEHDPLLLPSMRMNLGRIRSQIHACSGDTLEFKNILDSGLGCLLDCTQNMPGSSLFTSPQQRILYLWPLMVSNEFLDLMRKHTPPALVVFLHYCVILQLTEKESWIMDGWSHALASAVSAQLRDSPWAEEAQWPLERLEGKQIHALDRDI